MNDTEKIACTIQHQFKEKKVLVLGDLMVDEYIIGKVNRISPEAPIPVLNFGEKRLEAGGASNVANNMHSLGCDVFISGVAAKDEAGEWLRSHLMQSGIHTSGIIEEAGRPTSVKTRFATKGQQLLRMDNEKTICINEKVQNQILEYIQKKLPQLDAVVLSDYRKGVLDNPEFVAKLIRICNENHVLISIDSKSRNIEAFQGADFVKPNNLELEEAVGIKITDDNSLDRAGEIYLKRSGTKCLIVTRGAMGISVFLPGKKRIDFSSETAQVFDVTGAGDTVISTITLSLISGLSIAESIQLANYAASIVISKLGTAQITQEELLRRIHEG